MHEWEPAIEVLETIITSDPLWWVARQTLGRAQLGFGRVDEARLSFSRAALLNPSDVELRTEDLLWAQRLHQHKEAEAKAQQDLE